jgi:hypothetical protein
MNPKGPSSRQEVAMSTQTAVHRFALTALFIIVLAPLGASPIHAQQAPSASKPAAKTSAATQPTESQTQARAILMQMAQFLGTTPRFSVRLSAGYDAVQSSGQKIEFAETSRIIVNRPNNLRIEGERSDGAKRLVVFSGTEIVLIDSSANVIATAPQPGNLDETLVHFVGEMGIRVPLAALLLSRLPSELESRVKFVDYVEKTTMHGSPAHHLAARTDAVDFQVWVAEGDKPLPQRVVITYKNAPGQPQFWAQLSDWNVAPRIEGSTFAVEAPAGAQRVSFFTQIPRAAPTARQSISSKGVK